MAYQLIEYLWYCIISWFIPKFVGEGERTLGWFPLSTRRAIYACLFWKIHVFCTPMEDPCLLYTYGRAMSFVHLWKSHVFCTPMEELWLLNNYGRAISSVHLWKSHVFVLLWKSQVFCKCMGESYLLFTYGRVESHLFCTPIRLEY